MKQIFWKLYYPTTKYRILCFVLKRSDLTLHSRSHSSLSWSSFGIINTRERSGLFIRLLKNDGGKSRGKFGPFLNFLRTPWEKISCRMPALNYITPGRSPDTMSAIPASSPATSSPPRYFHIFDRLSVRITPNTTSLPSLLRIEYFIELDEILFTIRLHYSQKGLRIIVKLIDTQESDTQESEILFTIRLHFSQKRLRIIVKLIDIWYTRQNFDHES